MPIYMKFEGVKGDATGDHDGWIELQSAQLATGGNRPGGSGGGKLTVSEIVVTKRQDGASSGLFRKSLDGKGAKVTIEFVNRDGTAYMSIDLEGALVTSYSISGHGGERDERPVESLTLNFSSITFTTKKVSPPADPKHAMEKVEWNDAVVQYSID